ncbi:unnamed protein product [Sphagnum jensenii]
MLVWLGKMFSQHADEGTTEAKRKVLNGCLEWIYEMLISPVADLLNDMEEEDKLIIVAPEILSNVPFAALRKPNSPEGEGYLIQSHTICVTPSLRMLERCKQRLKELDQDGLLDTKPGTIVAVGDPACKARLEASGEEVDFIEEVFGEEYVKKLVGSEATPSEVLKWAKYPSEDRVKQVVMHIAAHGIGQDDRLEVKKGTAGQGAMLRAQDDENFDYDNAHDETELGDLSFSMVDELQAGTSSCEGHDGGTSSDTKAEQRFKDVKVKPLDLVSYINRFPKLAGDELDERSHINRFLELVGGKPHEFSDINHLLEKLDDLLDSLYWHENLEYALWGEG